MATFLPIRDTLSGINNTPIVDGQLLMTTNLGVNNRLFLDNNSNRTELGGAYLIENKTLYVSPTGSDTTGNGTSGSPYATPNKALSVIPKNMNGFDITIIMAGGTYASGILCGGFFGGTVNFTINGDISIDRIEITESGFVMFSAPSMYTITTSTISFPPITMSRGTSVRFNNLNLVLNSPLGSIYAGIYTIYASKCVMSNGTTTISGQANGIACQEDSEVTVENLVINSTNVGLLGLKGSLLSFNSITNNATNAYVTDNSSIITSLISEIPTTSNLGTVTTALAKRNINSCNFTLYAVSGTWTAGSSYTICTLSAPYRPTTAFLKEIILRGEGGTIYYGGLSITTSGVVSITPRQNMTSLLMRISEGYIV